MSAWMRIEEVRMWRLFTLSLSRPLLSNVDCFRHRGNAWSHSWYQFPSSWLLLLGSLPSLGQSDVSLKPAKTLAAVNWPPVIVMIVRTTFVCKFVEILQGFLVALSFHLILDAARTARYGPFSEIHPNGFISCFIPYRGKEISIM